MPRTKIPAVVAALGALLLAACSSTTSGAGSGTITPTGTDSHDFPAQTSAGTAPTSATSTSAAPSSSQPAGSTARTHPVPAAPLRTVTVHGAHGTYVIKVWAKGRTATCPDHAYGAPVISYLKAHPCTDLTRLLATTVVGGKAVGFAQSTLGFRGVDPRVYEVAGGFAKLVTKDGTGNLDDLFRDGYRLPGGPQHVPSPDAFDVQGQDAGVTVVDAWYLAGSTPENDPPLVRMAADIFLQV